MQFGRFPFEQRYKRKQVLGQSFLSFVCKIPCYTILLLEALLLEREDRVLGKGKKGLSIRHLQSTCPFQTLCLYYVFYSICIPMRSYTKKHVLSVYKKLIPFSFFLFSFLHSFALSTSIHFARSARHSLLHPFIL